MAGIISGMQNMKGELAKEANSIASTIEKTIKKKLKIHSPSRLMDQVGSWFLLVLLWGFRMASALFRKQWSCQRCHDYSAGGCQLCL
ncbi:hypothetical protein [Bacillus amyloliquefaciens]|uniref:hypothetical protein n=1 Tax=Bacillus amyloliquefaciens TaxID=1390 RepID=UPI0039C88FAB